MFVPEDESVAFEDVMGDLLYSTPSSEGSLPIVPIPLNVFSDVIKVSVTPHPVPT